MVTSGGSRISQTNPDQFGCQSQRCKCQPIIWPHIFWKLHKNERNWTENVCVVVRERGCPCAPIGSANGNFYTYLSRLVDHFGAQSYFVFIFLWETAKFKSLASSNFNILLDLESMCYLSFKNNIIAGIIKFLLNCQKPGHLASFS